jgi:hypothetical protein
VEEVAVLGHSLLIRRFGESSIRSSALLQSAPIDCREKNGPACPQSFCKT